MQSEVMPDRPGLLVGARGWMELMIARLRPGVSHQQAQAVADAAFTHGIHARGEDAPIRSGELAPHLALLSGARGFSTQRAYFGESLTILTGLAGMVLLIAWRTSRAFF
jgi:hypothetical protein